MEINKTHFIFSIKSSNDGHAMSRCQHCKIPILCSERGGYREFNHHTTELQ
uniref:Uncharacterized protein n=1 Tax=Anguilla anguilla TaxID=7936 RepID=A0A0E9VZM8_ANGAN